MAELSMAVPSPLDNDDVEPLGLSMLLDLEEDEDEIYNVGDLRITLRGYPREAGQTLACTGETTWRGGDILAQHLWDSRAALAGSGAVLEVGAGLGLVSLVAARLAVGDPVVATDGDDRALARLRHNVGGAGVEVARLRWGDAADVRAARARAPDGYGLILGADVVYSARAVRPLAATARALLAPGGRFLVAYTRRGVDCEAVVDACEREGFSTEEVPLEDRRDAGDRLFAFTPDPDWGSLDVASLAASLETRGFGVADANGFSARLAGALAAEIECLHDCDMLRDSPNALATGGGGRAVLAKRGVLELQTRREGARADDPGAAAAADLCPILEAFADGAAPRLGQRLGAALGVDLRIDEVKAARHGPGGCFPAHFDTTSSTGRVVTAVLYLAESWATGDGGELRIYPADGTAPVDVPPKAATLVVFSSVATLHRTLPLVRGSRPLVSFWFAAASGDLPPALKDASSKALVKLRHADDYARSFRDAFLPDGAVDAALGLDAEANARAEAALAPADAARLAAWRAGVV